MGPGRLGHCGERFRCVRPALRRQRIEPALQKGIDGFTPVGPELIAAADIDPADLRVRTWVNDELVQDAATCDEPLFDFGTIVADLARLMTLEPGDIILTGTPTGSTVVEPGDVVAVEVTAGSRSSGRLRSPIVESAYQLPTWGAMLVHGRRHHRGGPGAGGPAPEGDPVEQRYGAVTWTVSTR